MATKIHRPTSPSRRRSSQDAFSDITKSTPEKGLTVRVQKRGGRNNQGKITVRHRGGGAKRRYRLVDFSQNRFDDLATILSIEYDPNRSSRIALVEYKDKAHAYIIAPHGLKPGDVIISTQSQAEMNPGNRMPLGHIAPGILVHNIELRPGRGGKMIRSAGNSAVVLSHDEGCTLLKLSSGEVRRFPQECRASIGQISNPDWGNIRWGAAGRMRHRGFRPTVRGKAMNPVDHPHGGGEGMQPIGMKHPKTPQGKPALGVKTRKKGKDSDLYILTRRKKK